MDEEDQCEASFSVFSFVNAHIRQVHASRDKILIAGDEGEDEDGYDDEVFALNGVSDEDEDEDEYGMDVDDDMDDDGMDYEEKPSSKAAVKSKKKKSKGKGKVASSESEESLRVRRGRVVGKIKICILLF